MDITKQEVIDRLNYDPLTGDFTWKRRNDLQSKSWNTRFAGKKAGSRLVSKKNGDGSARAVYWKISLNDKPYLAHRLAWLIMTGNPPDDQIDHRDGDTLNNSFENLRECSNSQNSQNTRSRGATSSFKGVSLNQYGRWYAQLKHHGQHLLCKTFADEVEAAKAYDMAAIKAFGSFARLNFPLSP